MLAARFTAGYAFVTRSKSAYMQAMLLRSGNNCCKPSSLAMLGISSGLVRREFAVLVLTISILFVVAFATLSPQRSLLVAWRVPVSGDPVVLAGMPIAAGLSGWVHQSVPARGPSAADVNGRAIVSSYAAVLSHDEQRSGSNRVARSLVDAPIQLKAPSQLTAADDMTGRPAAVFAAAMLGASVLADAPAPPPAQVIAGTPVPAQRAVPNASPAQLPVTAVSATLPRASAQLPDLGLAPAPGPADSILAPTLDSDEPIADLKWSPSAGAANDPRACLHDEQDVVPAAVEGVIAGELPRHVGHTAHQSIATFLKWTPMCMELSESQC